LSVSGAENKLGLVIFIGRETAEFKNHGQGAGRQSPPPLRIGRNAVKIRAKTEKKLKIQDKKHKKMSNEFSRVAANCTTISLLSNLRFPIAGLFEHT